MPASLFAPGRVGIISRSGTLSYEFAGILSESRVGQSAGGGHGRGPCSIENLADILELFQEDEGTDAVIVVGEVGGEQEREGRWIYRTEDDQTRRRLCLRAAIRRKGSVWVMQAAIVRGTSGTVAGKHEALRAAGVEVLESPIDASQWARKHNLR